MAINNLVIISDIHAGDQGALCPPNGVVLEGGGTYRPSAIQKLIWAIWREFWDEFIPRATDGEPFAVVLNGDVVEGLHHGASHQISDNLRDQERVAVELLAPVVGACATDDAGRPLFWMIRGSEVHDYESGQSCEAIAETLRAQQRDDGRYSDYELWADIGGALCHILHHIGTTSSAQHETSALNSELHREISEATRFGYDPPIFVVRSHRHRYAKATMPAKMRAGNKHVEAVCFTTPAWQSKTPFAYRAAGPRVSPSQIGGAVIRATEGKVESKHFTRILGRDKTGRVVKL